MQCFHFSNKNLNHNQPTIVINLNGDEVPAAGVVGDADPALIELEAGYLADVDVVWPVGEDGVKGHAQSSPQRHQDRQHSGQHPWSIIAHMRGFQDL